MKFAIVYGIQNGQVVGDLSVFGGFDTREEADGYTRQHPTRVPWVVVPQGELVEKVVNG